MIAASLPAATESAPSEGPTVRSSTMVSSVGSAPDRNCSDSVVVLSAVNRPEICAGATEDRARG